MKKKHTKLLSIFNYSWTEGIDLFLKIFYSIKYFINKIILF